MPIPCYLALTAAEFSNTPQPPIKCAWMACHFSCYGTGLSNLPKQLPVGTMIILNDRMPPDRHDPQCVLEQLLSLYEEFNPDAFLLDFQRPNNLIERQIASTLVEKLPCPVGVSAQYAADLNCPIFLDTPPLHQNLSQYLKPFNKREIWLEMALQTQNYILNSEGCSIIDLEYAPLNEPIYTESSAFCRYHIETLKDSAVFTLQRSYQDWENLCNQTKEVSKVIGLYQQYKQFE